MVPFLRPIPFVIICIAISWLSHTPGEALPNIVLPSGFDKLLHFLMFLAVGASAFWGTDKRFFLSMGMAFCFACLDEYHQSFIPDRHAELLDIVADTLGLICGVCTFRWAVKNKMAAHHG